VWKHLNIRTIPTLRLTLVFAVALSLASLPGPLSNHFALPSVLPLAHANPAPNEVWYPAGPAMDTEIIRIYQDQISEFTGLQNRAIDLSDWRLDAGTSSAICGSSAFYCTSQVQERSFADIEFNLANNYWGISMNFGNDPNGLQLRQGIAHLVDKNSFSINERSGPYTPIDNPLPAGQSFGGRAVTYPNPCLWDQNNTETGTNCTTSTTGVGGIAYHLAAATGNNCGTESLQTACTYRWQPGFGSLDFCAAADHFITAFRHGLGITPTRDANCVLLAPGQTSPGAGWPITVTSNVPQFFVRIDDSPRYDLGTSMTQEICALFTGSFASGCTFLRYLAGTTYNQFLIVSPYLCPGPTSTSVPLCWWIYTGASGNIFPFDASLYSTYNSRFVYGAAGAIPPCSSAAGSTMSPANYMFLCNSAYDAASLSIEFATSLSNAFSAATQAMDIFGKHAFTIPVYTPGDTFGYGSNWSGVINGDGIGIPNSFTWLNARTNTPSTGTNGCPASTPLCIRQGFKEPTYSLNPYAASLAWDSYVLSGIYDTLGRENPANPNGIMNWMFLDYQQLSNTQLNYIPPGCVSQTVCNPGGTVSNLRFTLRNDIFWQDQRRVTTWDVQFSYTTLLANGAYLGSSLSSMVCITLNCTEGMTILSPTRFDLHLSQNGPFIRFSSATVPIIPGRYWSANCSGIIWDSDVASGSVPTSCMTTNNTSSQYDPIASGVLIGSGPWKCENLSTNTVGNGCTNTGSQNPPPGGTYTLTRFGIGHAPGSSVTDSYFRSSGALALDIWTGNTGDPTGDSINFSRVAACFGQPVGTTGCTHWQRGIGNPGTGTVIGGIQASIVLRFVFVNWVSPFDSTRSPPQGMVAFPPATLYEGSATFNNCVVDPVNGYDC